MASKLYYKLWKTQQQTQESLSQQSHSANSSILKSHRLERVAEPRTTSTDHVDDGFRLASRVRDERSVKVEGGEGDQVKGLQVAIRFIPGLGLSKGECLKLPCKLIKSV